MPDYINKAQAIEDEINNKAGTQDLDDDELIDEVIEVSSDNETTVYKVLFLVCECHFLSMMWVCVETC
jgi:hypothetical protein